MNTILNSEFAHLKPGVLFTTGGSIVVALTGNLNFPITSPALAVIQADLDALEKAIALPKGPARNQAIRATRKTLQKDLVLLATNLETTAAGDLVKLATTGYKERKPTAQTGAAPATPTDLRLKLTGVTGEVLLLLKAILGAKGYQVQTALDPVAGPWTDYDHFTSSRGIVLKGLPRKTDIWVRIRAIGPHNTKSGWSDPATILVS